MQTALDLDLIRDEFGIGDYISDDVMVAFADNWIDAVDVAWGELEESYCGTFAALDEDDAIGEYLFDLANDTGDLEAVPDWIRHHIDWRMAGRDARFNGDLRAVFIGSGGSGRRSSTRWAVFRNW